MSNGWETTEDDIRDVLEKHGVDTFPIASDDITDFDIDHVAIEKEAMRGDSMYDQLELAHKEIAAQLIGLGVL